MEKRIGADEFIERCAQARQMFIGNIEGLDKGKQLIAQLQDKGFLVELLDNDRQRNYSPNLWVKPTWRNSHGTKRFAIDANTLCTLMRLRPDEFHLEPDGALRLWWD